MLKQFHSFSNILVLLSLPCLAITQTAGLKTQVDQKALLIESKAIDWRHHLHANPELSNREFNTAQFVATHLRKLGLEVKTEIAHTGVVGILRGGKPGPVIGLRADMDALPVKERVDVPFASKAKGEYLGNEVDVMHACGHDAHMSILMGAAEILSSMKKDIAGTIVFIFQPAEESAPPGEEGGAQLMIKEGVLDDPPIDVIFGLHIRADIETGQIKYKPGSTMAAVNTMTIKVKGKQAHGSEPWTGVDPIVTSAQIILGLQTIVSRQMDISNEPVVISIGKIAGGVRSNIIPEEVEMLGTIRTFDTTMQRVIIAKIKHTIHTIAESMGATAEVEIDKGYPTTFNNLELTRKMLPTLFEVAGEDNVFVRKPLTGAEDFSFYQQRVPGLYYFLGGMPKGTDPLNSSRHHTPDFYIEDSSLLLGMRSMSYLVLDYLDLHKK
ncbi:MAG: amidohydrolase [Saprospiraceae bacterium]